LKGKLSEGLKKADLEEDTFRLEEASRHYGKKEQNPLNFIW